MRVRQPTLGCALFGYLVSAFPLLLGAGILYLAFLAPLARVREARAWVERPCRILSSTVEEVDTSSSSHSGPDRSLSSNTAFDVAVSFGYSFGGADYTSDRFDLSDAFDAREAWKRRLVDSLPPGAESVCYVNPDHPEEAVLSRDFHLSYWAAILPGMAILAGLAGVAVTWFACRRPPAMRTAGGPG